MPTPEEEVIQAIQTYGRTHWLGYVPMSTVRKVNPQVLGEIIRAGGAPPTSRTNKYRQMEQWCLANAGAEVSAYSLAEMFGMSPPTTRKFINDRIDLFKAVRRGFWIIRDVQAERAEKHRVTPL